MIKAPMGISRFFFPILLAQAMVFHTQPLLAASILQSQYGARDSASEILIGNINLRAEMRSKAKYADLSSSIQNEISRHPAGTYGRARLLNELADIYSYNLFYIENAIKIDEEIISSSIPDQDVDNRMLPVNEVANNKIIIDKSYFASYAKITSSDIKEAARNRLQLNRGLLEGLAGQRNKEYSLEFIEKHHAQVRSDVLVGRVGANDRNMMLSRLIRAEYELHRLDPSRPIIEYGKLLNGEISIRQIDFTEISFLDLADYLMQAHQLSAEVRLAELALDVVYLPYANLQSMEYRWKYNKLINSYISTLIEANFKAGRFDEVLYYANLNKSRMLLEERLTFGAGKAGNARISDLVADDGIPRTAAGLPDKAWFKAKLAGTPQFLDFYVGGTYVADSGSKAARAERSVMPLSSRNSARVSAASEPTEVFKDDALYITQVVGGQATAVKVTGPELAALRREMEKSYAAISETQKVTASPTLQTLKSRLRLADTLTVSPDKWVSTHPLDFHLQARTVRSVNFFTSGASGKLGQLAVAGFFNPTLDLKGADAEADTIKALIPQASIIRREAARKSALASASAANIIHLSMHGNFNDSDPTLSKLVFAGAANDDSTGDPNALYATEMATVPTLRNRDLVFAAACQTGLQAADRTNTSELTGILRPLTANRNKNLILSLWNVSDQATGEFVKAFYQRLAATQDVKDAFHHAQDQLRAKYPHPYYWAAFYLSQAS